MCEEPELSPKQAGPRIDDSGSGKICAISAISAIRGCLARSLSLLRGCRTVQSTYNAPPGHVASNTVAKAQCKLAAFPSITEALLQNFNTQSIALQLKLTSTGDKRDNMSAYALRISDCRVCHPASVILWPWLARAFR
jgi:hypothetical protein